MENVFLYWQPGGAREGNPFHQRLNCCGINTLSVGNRVERSAVRDGNEARRRGETRPRPLAAQQ